ncbi:MAG: hypothetical protein J6D36_06895, partial [Erysipelotrichaceae bacterium]|nr:hypothetical protein [Erysipelotrichaceae bacterium]
RFHSVTQSASDGMPVITVKNKAFDLKAVKQEESGEPSSRKLGGAHFDLYREVTINGITLMDFNPMTGYTDLISADTTGVIQGITEALPPGVYYLKETIAPSGYDLDPKPIRFAITETGYVSMDQTDNASFFETNENGVVHYVITISNVRATTAPTGIKLGRIYYIILIAAGLLLMMKGDLFRRFLR